MKEWTVELAKEQLPDVDVMFKTPSGNVILHGTIRGRNNEFATVSVRLPAYNVYWHEEFAWETIVGALNAKCALHAN